MNKRDLRFITKALEVSLESDYPRIKIGTVITRGNQLVAMAANIARSHPTQKGYNQLAQRETLSDCLHSEVHAVIRSRGVSTRNATAYVARYERTGNLGDCKPCAACTIALRDAGIRRVVYTTKSGIQEYSYR